MKNELTIKDKQPTAVAPLPNSTFNPGSNINISGGENTLYGYVERLKIVNVYNNDPSSLKTVINTHCNIIVLKDKEFDGRSFSILKRRAYIAGFINPHICSYPTLFIKSNDDYLKCVEPNQEFRYGFINEIVDEGDYLKVYYAFGRTAALLQSKLIDIAVNLGITKVKGVDRLDETGWRIYPIDIVKILQDAGILTIY